MNKKFLSVVLFGALMAGSSVTFTGCIDNDEPAGITDLRGAKSELIRANAAYKLVEVEIRKVDIERQQVALERDKIQMEIEKLDLEIKKATSDYAITLWQNKKDSVIADFKGKLFKLQKTAADNEAAYLKALAELEAVKVVETDVVFAKKLDYIIGELKSVRNQIKTTSNQIIRLNNKLLAFASNHEGFLKGQIVEDIKFYNSELANDSVRLAEFQKMKDDYSEDAINAQKVDIEKQIIAIDKKVAELKLEVLNATAEKAPIEQALSKQKVTFEAKNQSVALDVPSAIESEFIGYFIKGDGAETMNALAGEDWAASQTSNIETKKVNDNDRFSFKQAPVLKELQLGTVKNDNTIDAAQVLSAQINNFGNAVEAHGVTLYRKAYGLLKAVSAYNLPDISTSGDITAEDKAKVAVALEKVNADLTTAKTAYEADTTALKTAYAAYKTAATAYGITQQLTSTIEKGVNTKWEAYVEAKGTYDESIKEVKSDTYEAAVKAQKEAQDAYDAALKDADGVVGNVSTDIAAALTNANTTLAAEKAKYDEAMAKVNVAALTAATTALKTELTSYYPKAKALLGLVFKAEVEGVNKGEEFVIADKLATLSNDDFHKVMQGKASTLAENKDNIVTVNEAGDAWETVAVNASSTDNDGAAQTWIKASYKLYTASDGSKLASTIKAGLGVAKTTILPLEDVIANLGTAIVASSNASAVTYVVLQNAKNAFSTIDDWTSYAESLSKTAAEKAALEAPIIAEVAKQKAALDAIYEPFRDKLYEICKLDATQFTDTDLTDIFTGLGIETMNDEGEKQALEALLENLENIGGEINISYTYYTIEDDGKIKSDTGTITSTDNFADAVDNIQTSIKALREYISIRQDDLAEYENGSHEIESKTKAEYENQLANLQERLKDQQALFDTWTKAKEDLIAAMTAE